MLRLLLCLAALQPLAGFGAEEVSGKISLSQERFFEARIRPVLEKNCYSCHSSKTGQQRGGLKLDTRQATLLGGDSGPAVVPGNLDESLLYQALLYDGFAMPPSGPLPRRVVDDFREWIESGAADPRVQKRAKLNATITKADIARAKRTHWAYQQPKTVDPSPTSDGSWAETPIDSYVLAKLEAEGMTPAVDADPHTVLRRLTLDLVGLPPTPEQIVWFTAAWRKAPTKAVERVVDRLLDSDLFGERWGRHWLDVARYAESSGKEINVTFPQAWRYRDYVIDSFNADKPYDQFLVEQIAGDLLPAKSDEQWSEHLVATTFLAVGPKALIERNGRQFAADLIDEQIDVTTRVVLGTSVACARCHDHKFDAIAQEDYYALAGIFLNTETFYGTIDSARNRRPSDLIILPTFDSATAGAQLSQSEFQRLKKELDEAEAEEARVRRIRQRVIFRGETGPDLPDKDDPILSIQRIALLGRRVTDLRAKLSHLDENGRAVGKCMGVQSVDYPRDAPLLVRGELDQPAQTVSRGVPRVLEHRPVPINRSSSGRREFAEYLADDRNPLTARVMANRVWSHLLGQGIVASTEDFGATGDTPSHPDLLDYLANRFVECEWSVKSLVREIATSRVYRTSSDFNSAHFEKDPENRMLWRVSPRRLDAEVIRDSMLYASGELELDRPMGSLVSQAGDATVNGGRLQVDDGSIRSSAMTGLADRMGRRGRMGGDASMMQLGIQALAGRGRSVSLDVEDANYRSVYMPIVRDFVPRSLAVFDFPDASMIVGARDESNTANQALYMLNNPLVIRTSEALADRVVREAASPAKRLDTAFLMVFGRPASASEESAVAAFVREAGASRSSRAAKRLYAQVCQALFASAEFRYRY